MAVLYIHINKVNNKKYVGITNYSNPEMRWGKEGRGYINSKFYEKGISQFGWDNFTHIILNDDIDEDTAQQLESRIIKELKLTEDDYGYNEHCGVKIRIDNALDNLCTTLIKTKINPLDNSEILQIEYRHNRADYRIDFLYTEYQKNNLNTNMDCQRGYVWTEERQQGMWDSLLFGHRIPEFHAIRHGSKKWDIIDGKQRLTTIMEILNNNIPCKKSYASERLVPLFKFINKSSFYFKDLPDYLQDRVLSTMLTFAEYYDVDGDDLVTLFRKLNASMALDEFSKGIANYILVRTDFTKHLIEEHNILLESIFSENARSKSEDEKYLLRLAILLKEGLKVDLSARNMSQLYPSFTRQDLENLKNKISNHLTRITKYISLLKSFKSIKSYLPIISYIVISKKLSDDQIEKFFCSIKNRNYPGRGDELNKATILNRYNELLTLL